MAKRPSFALGWPNRNAPFGWLSLDESDNDPTIFFTYFTAALQQIDSQLGASIDNWSQPTTSLMQLCNDIMASGMNMILVLDDYHHIDSMPIHKTLEFLIEHAPPNLHLVLISRTDPPLPLARLRVRAQMTEIRADALRFTQDEAVQFFTNTMSLTLSSAEVRRLEERTEGWVAGLQMAGVALQGSNPEVTRDPREFIQNFSGSHRYISDSVDPNLAFLAIFSRDCRDFGVIYSDFGYRKQPISYLKIAQI
ncbi:hypothetical protein KFU94_65270 [Chloroflexi bacterium TSY]|nr:hypothetical protein [Chloroflexi bacterium TSY]